MLGYLKKKTGANERELVKALDLAPSRVKYHLAVLQSADLVAYVDQASEALDQYVATASPPT